MEVLYGPFHRLEEAFLERLQAAKRNEPLAPILVAAPSRRLADRLTRLAAGKGLFEVQFLTFYSLALRVVGDELPKPVLGDSLFYDKLVDRLIERRGGFESRYRGLSSAVRSSIKDLADAGAEPGPLLEQAREGLFGADADDPIRLLELYADYRRELERLDVLAPAGLAKLAAEAAPASAFLARFEAVFYYGFYDLTGLQTDFFQAVAKSRPGAVFFPYRAKDPAYAFAKRFFEAQLHFGGPPKSVEDAQRLPKIEIRSASGASDELWAAAKAVLKLVEEEGLRFDEIGVAARTLEPYRPHLERVFAENRIPFHTTAEEPLLRYPAAKQALALLTWGRRDYPAVSMADLLGSPAFRRRSDAWKSLVERLRIHQGWLQWEGKLGTWAEKGPDEEIPREQARSLLEFLRGLRGQLDPKGGGWAGFALHARRLLAVQLDFVQDSPEVAEAIEDILSGLALHDRIDPEPTWDRFLETLEEAFARKSLALTPRANLGVRVLDAMAARGESFRALLLLGLKEKLFPRLIREDPFLRDRHRAALRDTAGYWISTKLGGYEEEKLLFRLMVEAARERLICSYPRSDEDGKPQVKSIYLMELEREAGAGGADPAGAGKERPVPLRPLAKFDSEPRRLTPKEASVRLVLAGGDPSPLFQVMGGSAEAYGESLAAADAIRAFDKPGPFDGAVGAAKALHRRLLKGLSPTAVQTFAVCPFRFFAGHVLRLSEPEEANERKAVPPDVRGRIYHRFLERLYRDLAGKDVREFPRAAFDLAADETFGEFGWRSLGVYPLLWRALREEMLERLEAFVRADLAEQAASGRRPDRFELELSGALPIHPPKALEGLKFKGRADRIDVVDGAYQVVDYKTRLHGRMKLQTQLLRARSLQLAFYLELAAGAVEGKPDGAALVGIESEDRRWIGRDEWLAARGTVWKNLTAMLAQMGRGEFFIYPDRHCDWCAFSGVCRKSHGPSLVRARRAPGWAPYAAMVAGKPAAVEDRKAGGAGTKAASAATGS